MKLRVWETGEVTSEALLVLSNLFDVKEVVPDGSVAVKKQLSETNNKLFLSNVKHFRIKPKGIISLENLYG